MVGKLQWHEYVLVDIPNYPIWKGEFKGYSADGLARVVKEGTMSLRYIHPNYVKRIEPI